jgi:hypothetical protein
MADLCAGPDAGTGTRRTAQGWFTNSQDSVHSPKPCGMVALAAPRRTGRPLPGRRRRLGGREPGGEYRERIAHALGVGAGERGQRGRRPSAAERGLDGWGEPGSLLAGEHPRVLEPGEELADAAAASSAAAGPPAHARAWGRQTAPGMVPWAVRVQLLHPVAAPVAPRRRAGCTSPRPRGATAAPGHPGDPRARRRSAVNAPRWMAFTTGLLYRRDPWPAGRGLPTRNDRAGFIKVVADQVQVPVLRPPVGALDSGRDDVRVAR